MGEEPLERNTAYLPRDGENFPERSGRPEQGNREQVAAERGGAGGIPGWRQGPVVEDVDLEILRQMYRGGRWARWSVDPRISLQEIAEKVGVPRGLVAGHIRAWRQQGYLLGYHASPSLRLFGCGLQAVEFTVCNNYDAERMLDRLELVDGIVSAKTFCGDIRGERAVSGIWVLFVDDHPLSVERRLRLLREFFAAEQQSEPVQLVVPAAPPAVSTLDWRILGSFVDRPELGLGDRADLLRVTPKTLSRRLNQLVDTGCLDYDLLLDWTKSPTVALAIFSEDASVIPGIQFALRSRFRYFLTLVDSEPGRSLRATESIRPNLVWAVVPIQTPSEVHQVVDSLRMVSGVVDVRPDYWGVERFYPDWFIPRISEKIKNHEGPDA